MDIFARSKCGPCAKTWQEHNNCNFSYRFIVGEKSQTGSTCDHQKFKPKLVTRILLNRTNVLLGTLNGKCANCGQKTRQVKQRNVVSHATRRVHRDFYTLSSNKKNDVCNSSVQKHIRIVDIHRLANISHVLSITWFYPDLCLFTGIGLAIDASYWRVHNMSRIKEIWFAVQGLYYIALYRKTPVVNIQICMICTHSKEACKNDPSWSKFASTKPVANERTVLDFEDTVASLSKQSSGVIFDQESFVPILSFFTK